MCMLQMYNKLCVKEPDFSLNHVGRRHKFSSVPKNRNAYLLLYLNNVWIFGSTPKCTADETYNEKQSAEAKRKLKQRANELVC